MQKSNLPEGIRILQKWYTTKPLKVFQILEEEKQEALNKRTLEIAENFIKAGADTLMIMKGTGLTKE